MRKIIIKIILFFPLLISCQHEVYKYDGMEIRVFSEKNLYRKKDIRGLDLSGDTTGIPLEVFSLDELLFLNLSNKEMKKLPPEICKISSLKSLILTNNQIEGLPDCIFESELEVLSLIGCKLDSIPYGLTRMSRLKYLAIAGNRFSDKYLNQLKKELPNTQIVIGID